ncbi:AraC family transcriptional regulator [Gordonia sinesedis]
MSWELPRAPVSAQLLTRFGEDQGIPAATLLHDTGLTVADLADPRCEVSARQELTIIDNLVTATGDQPGLGVALGERYHLTAYGIWSFMLISSPTPRQAIQVALRFLDLTFAFCDITAHDDADGLRLTLDASRVPDRLRRFVVERDLSAVYTIRREAFADRLPLRRVDLSFPAPDGPLPPGWLRDAVDEHPDVLHYDADTDAMIFDAARIDDPMPQANAHAAAVAQEQCARMLQERRARAGVSGDVRELLVRRLTDPPDASEVAGLLHMSSRTLQRRLAQEGTSFRALLDEVREQIAEELLVVGGLPVAEVAHRLGYVEVSSFSQAFRRWTGSGPRAFRDARLPGRRVGA